MTEPPDPGYRPSHREQPAQPPAQQPAQPPARGDERGRPEVTEIEVGQRRYAVASVEPLDVDGVRTVTVGTALWVVALVALLPFVGTLRDGGHIWWLWTCLAGFGLGLIGIEYCRRRRHTLRLQPERRRTETSQFGAAGS